MKSRWIINILLIVAVVILTLVARYEPGIETPAGPQTLTSLRVDQIQSIRVNRPLREDLLFSKTNNTWAIDREPPVPADEFQVRALLRLAEQVAARSYPVEELELSRLALDPPYATVTLDGIEIDFGSLEPLQELRYTRVGDHVHLISDMYQHLIEADYTQFVRRRLLADEVRVSGLDVPGFSLARVDGRWQITPSSEEVSADALQQLIDNWQQASALHVRPAEATPGDAQEVTLSLGEPERRVRFLIAAREPELVLVRPEFGLQYHMGNRADSLLAPPEVVPSSDP